MQTTKRLSTVKNLPSQYPGSGLTESSIRWLIFNSSENGFAMCIRRLGRKVLIDLDIFEQWMDDQATKGGHQL